MQSRSASIEFTPTALQDSSSGSLENAVILHSFDVQDDSMSHKKSMGLKNHPNLLKLRKRHEEERLSLEKQAKQEQEDFELSIQAQLQEMEERQQEEIEELLHIQASEMDKVKAAQEKEILMEETMHDTELKMVLERKILGTLLNNLDDGVINISTRGEIIRFNRSAQDIFGYTEEEVIGKNVTMLMPREFAENHQAYLQNYLTTGIKKVIGLEKGRQVIGLRKNGQEFELHLAVSEVKTDTEHFFTGIARDASIDLVKEQQRQLAITEVDETIKNSQERLRASLAHVDSLRRTFLPRNVQLKQLAQRKHVAFALLQLNEDFEWINHVQETLDGEATLYQRSGAPVLLYSSDNLDGFDKKVAGLLREAQSKNCRLKVLTHQGQMIQGVVGQDAIPRFVQLGTAMELALERLDEVQDYQIVSFAQLDHSLA